jgi:RNA polymerase sigma-70 factor (ECF subfamily)
MATATTTAPPDAELVSANPEVRAAVGAFQAGEDREAAFRSLFDAFYRPLLRFFARKGFGPEDCRDLTQETLLGIYHGLDGYRRDARFESWLYRIATTTYLKRRRAEHAAMRSGEEVSTDDDAKPLTLGKPAAQLDTVLERERADQLAAAIAELPEQMRKVLLMRLHRQLSYKEIATVLRVSTETVKAHLFQARKRLKERLGEGAVASWQA